MEAAMSTRNPSSPPLDKIPSHESSPPWDPKPRKRPDAGSSSSHQPSPAKKSKSKSNVTDCNMSCEEEDESCKDLDETDPLEEEVFPEYDDQRVLPPGYMWSSCGNIFESDHQVVLMVCLQCGVAGDHQAENCPNKNTPKAIEFRKESFPELFEPSGQETEPETE